MARAVMGAWSATSYLPLRFFVTVHFFSLLSGGHSSLEPRLPIPNRTVKRVCADDSVPFAHAKVGYRQAIFDQESPASKEDRAFLFYALWTARGRLSGLVGRARIMSACLKIFSRRSSRRRF